MKKFMISMLFISLFFISSCGDDEAIEPNFSKVKAEEGYSENGNSGGTGGSTNPPGTGG